MKSLLTILSILLFTSTFLYAEEGDSCSHAKELSLDASLDTTLAIHASSRMSGYYYYYYKFTPTSDGEIIINTTGITSDGDAWLYDSENKCDNANNYIASDTRYNDNVSITYQVTSGTTYYLPIVNNRNWSDDFHLTITLSSTNTLPVVENAADMCYGAVSENCSGATCQTITPINTLSASVTDAIVYFDTSSLFSIPFFGSSIDDCSVDNGARGDNCQEDSNGNSIGPFSMFNSGGWTFTLGDILATDNRSISTYADRNFFDFINDFFSRQGAIQATYIKDGTQYRGALNPCDLNAPLISDVIKTIPNSTADGTNIAKMTSSQGAADTYTIDSGNSENLFSIDDYGNVTVSGIPTAGNSTYVLGITATNTQGSSSATLTVNIIDNGTTIYHEGVRPFELINPVATQNIIGNTQIVGNTVECVTTTSYASSADYSNLTCDNTVGNYNNNNYTVKYIDIDSNNTLTYNSSSATIELPGTFKEIAWVGLYWQAHINNNSWIYYNSYNDKLKSDDYPSRGIEATTANQVLLKIGNNAYQTIVAQTVDYFSTSSYARYSAFANITKLFTSTYNPNEDIDITVANIAATRGLEDGLGNYGAWTIVVVYKEDELNNLSKLRNNSVYLGYQYVSSNSGDREITLNDFLLPKRGTIDSQMAVFAAEGEYRYYPDTMQLDGVSLGDPDTNNVFDARLSDSITRSPHLVNNNGIDIDVFDTSAIMTAKRDSNPDAITYSSTISLTSDADLYYPSMVSFTTELYKPRVCYYIDTITDSSGTNIFDNGAFLTGKSITPNEVYTFNFFISNMKKDLTDTDIEQANKVQVYLNMTNFNYSPNSTYLKNINSPEYVIVTDQNATQAAPDVKDDLGEYSNNKSTWRVGSGASNIEGGTLDVATNFSDTANIAYINLQASLSTAADTSQINLLDFIEFKASFQTDTITIGEDNAQLIAQCQDLNSSGNVGIAPSGKFNVVNTNFSYPSDPADPTDPNYNTYNALPTQVSNRNFNVKVLALDTDNKTILPNYIGDVNVSIIQTPVYPGTTEGDQLACDTATQVTTPQNITFIASDHGIKTVTISNTSIALKDASFRIQYSSDGYACSRDFFAIRPDKFILSSPTDIELLHSGKSYNFSLIAAQDSTVTPTQNYNIANAQNIFTTLDNYKTIFAPDNSIPSPVLNGTLSFNATNFNISNGYAGNVVGMSFDDVGKVNIKFIDSNWSKVDIDNGDTPLDCSLTGAYICGDINATFIPDHFSITAANLFNASASTYTYLSNDLTIAAGISATVTAENFANNPVQNFDTAAWENPVNIALTLPSPADTSLNENKNDINSSAKIGFGNGQKNILYSDTNKTTDLIFNFSRDKTVAVNPFKIDGADITLRASSLYTSSSGTKDTILSPNTVTGNSATFVYGRSHAPRQKFVDDTINGNHDAFIYYEVYCNGTVNGNDCNKTLLPNGINATYSDDPRWFINTNHTVAEGTAGTVAEKNNAHVITVQTQPTGSAPDKVVVNYDGTKGYPYTKTMTMTPSAWLIYNKYNASANKNDFVLEFYKDGGGYVGSGKSENSVKVKKSSTFSPNENKSWW